jgi:hypothetical protein
MTATALVVVYATTDDNPMTGEPIVPGFLDDGLSWRVRSHLPDGHTRWIGLGLPAHASTQPASREDSQQQT